MSTLSGPVDVVKIQYIVIGDIAILACVGLVMHIKKKAGTSPALFLFGTSRVNTSSTYQIQQGEGYVPNELRPPF